MVYGSHISALNRLRKAVNYRFVMLPFVCVSYFHGRTKRVKETTAKAQPKDYADIVVSEPVRILVKAADKK